jgi:pyridoxine/pyridoxamine 5'-phosphate oxidase
LLYAGPQAPHQKHRTAIETKLFNNAQPMRMRITSSVVLETGRKQGAAGSKDLVARGLGEEGLTVTNWHALSRHSQNLGSEAYSGISRLR